MAKACAGIDTGGSRTTKLVIVDDGNMVRYRHQADSSFEAMATAQALLAGLW